MGYTKKEWGRMENGNDLEKATIRLDSALQSIEDAVASKRKSELKNESLEERIQSLESNIDSERRLNEKLNATNEEVSERIETVISSIDDMLRSS